MDEKLPTFPHNYPQGTPAIEGEDTVYDAPEKPEDVPYHFRSTGNHEHVWLESEEVRDDGMKTVICQICGAGMHYHAK